MVKWIGHFDKKKVQSVKNNFNMKMIRYISMCVSVIKDLANRVTFFY